MERQKNNSDVFVTNATANSIAKTAAEFLNLNFSSHQILGLRKKYSLSNLNNNTFTKEELLSEFINQTIYFLNMYSYINSENRLNNFFLSKGWAYKRKIFHLYHDCPTLYYDYESEEIFYPNSGLFGRDKLKDIYFLKKYYLIKLGMSQCSDCTGKEFSNFYQTITFEQHIEYMTIIKLRQLHPTLLGFIDKLSLKEILQIGLKKIISKLK